MCFAHDAEASAWRGEWGALLLLLQGVSLAPAMLHLTSPSPCTVALLARDFPFRLTCIALVRPLQSCRISCCRTFKLCQRLSRAVGASPPAPSHSRIRSFCREMEEGIESGMFLEHANVHGNLYGTARSSLESMQLDDTLCTVDIDVQVATPPQASSPSGASYPA